MANVLPGPAGETLQRPALQQEPSRRRSLYRSVEAAMASCVCWDASVDREQEGVVCESDPDAAVTVTVDVTGAEPPDPAEPPTPDPLPLQPLSRLRPAHLWPAEEAFASAAVSSRPDAPVGGQVRLLMDQALALALSCLREPLPLGESPS